VFVAENVGTIPEIKLLKASFIVIVTVAEAVPFAIVGPVAVIVEAPALGAPAMKEAIVEVIEVPAGVKILIVLASALVEFKVQVESPLTSVTEQAPKVLPEPVEEIVGVSPAKTTPLFLTLIEIVEVATPSATMFDVAEMVVRYVDEGVTTPPAPGALLTLHALRINKASKFKNIFIVVFSTKKKDIFHSILPLK
jgi:hypothetical protein